jgi:hypothetical protein
MTTKSYSPLSRHSIRPPPHAGIKAPPPHTIAQLRRHVVRVYHLYNAPALGLVFTALYIVYTNREFVQKPLDPFDGFWPCATGWFHGQNNTDPLMCGSKYRPATSERSLDPEIRKPRACSAADSGQILFPYLVLCTNSRTSNSLELHELMQNNGLTVPAH